MALNRFMHPRNRYKDNKPDFAKLAEKYPEFAKHVSVNLAGNTSLDFHDPQSLRALTCTLLKEDFELDIELPLDRIIPTVPLRLNYIHWIEDILRQCEYTTNIHGIDIGCGASCIYPLLGCQMNGWHFAASEVDELALQYACDNVKRNNLQDKIKVLASPPDTLIQGIFKAVPQPLYHFTMCNPPFFGNMLEAQGIMSRTMCRPEPKSISTASEVEMIYEGGEVDFIKRMIAESLQLREQVLWYTSMVGKKSSLGPLKEELKKHKIRNYTTAEFCQGRTMRWGIAWTFHDDIDVPPPSKRRKEKHRPPLIITVPDAYVDKALEEMKSNTPSSAKGHKEKIQAIAETTKQILDDLQISFVVQPSSRKIIKLECTACKNTWANQRRKRRQRQKLKQQQQQQQQQQQDSDNKAIGIHGNSDIQESGSSKGVQTITNAEGIIDCVESEKGEVPLDSPDIKSGPDLESRYFDTKDQVDHEVFPQIGQEHQPLNTTAEMADSNPDSGMQGKDRCNTWGDRSKPENPAKCPSISFSQEDRPVHYSDNLAERQCQAQGDAPGEDSLKPSPENIADSQQMLFKCIMIIKIIDENVSIEMNWLDGSSRESLHQVGQYMKNQFNK